MYIILTVLCLIKIRIIYAFAVEGLYTGIYIIICSTSLEIFEYNAVFFLGGGNDLLKPTYT